VHRGQVIGTAVPASSESRQRNEDAAGDQRSDLRGRQCGGSFGSQDGASRDEAPEEMIFRMRDAASNDFGRGVQSGTQEKVFPRRAAEHRSALTSVRPGGAKQKRGFGWRTGVEAARLLFGGSDRWDATPELVSRNSGLGSPGT